MTDSILMVLHGMGEHSKASVEKEVKDAANKALHRYKKYEGLDYGSLVEVVGIGYDHIFEAERKRLDQQNTSVSQFLKASQNVSTGFISKIAELEDEIGEDNFFTTHALDVIFYLTLLGELVRLEVVDEISKVWEKKGDARVHILGHSLGTAVLHDTLQKAYTGGIADEDGKSWSLDLVNQKFDSLWMVANVSNLICSLTPFDISFDPFKSIVKPGDGNNGCTSYFYNIYHELDPFTLFYRFAPKLSQAWIEPRIYRDYYREISTEAISSTKNPHDLGAYIADPEVSYPFLRRTLPQGAFSPGLEEIQEAHLKFKNLKGEYKKIEDHVKSIDTIKDIRDLVRMMDEFEKYINDLD